MFCNEVLDFDRFTLKASLWQALKNGFFINTENFEYFLTKLISVFDARCVLTSKDRRNGRENRGGMTTYSRVRNDIITCLRSDQTAYVSTMVDFFRLPTDFPGYEEAMSCLDHCQSATVLEHEWKQDILFALPGMPADRFIPYIQLHEFEALLYTDLRVLELEYFDPADLRRIQTLYEETKDIPPEEINHGAETAPSKRLLKTVSYQKGDGPAELLDVITIDKIRQKCGHFSQWLDTLQRLPEIC